MYDAVIDPDSALNHLEHLCDGLTNDERAEYMYSSFEELGLTVSTDVINYYGHTGLNVYANYIGDPGSQDYLIIGAHHDRVDKSPGANDNGSGSVALLELAHTYVKTEEKTNILFASYGMEEMGLLGSEFHAKSLKDNEKEHIIGMFNLDCIGNGPDLSLSIKDIYSETDPWMNSIIKDTAKNMGLSIVDLENYAGTSDHTSYIEQGIRAACLSRREEGHIPYIHTPEDTIEHMNIDQWVEAMDLAVFAGINLYKR